MFGFENPFFFAIIILIFTVSSIFIFYRFVLVPMKRKHIREQETLKLQQAEMTAKLAELSPDPIIRFNTHGKILLANNAAKKIFHATNLDDTNITKLLYDIRDMEPDGIIINNSVKTFTSVIDDKTFQFIVGGISKYGFAQIYGRDITELKNAEAELKLALVKAEEAKKVKEDFLSRISHEIRSPLVAIQGYAEMLKSELGGSLNEDYQQLFRSIENNSKRLYRTVDLILNMSQLHAGKYEPIIEDIRVIEMISRIKSEFESFAEEKDIELTVIKKLDESAFINTDRYAVEQIFVNLIDNALKFTNRGYVKIHLEENTDTITISVEDTGIGMSDDYLKTVFTPFSQEKTGYTRPYEGAGLGLALVNQFITICGGKINVKSEPEKGSKFQVTFTTGR